VKSLGLNSEDSVLCKDLAETTAAIEKWPKTSVRTMAPQDGNDSGFYGATPHIPALGQEDALMECSGLLMRGWWLIISECIDPKDALMAGAVRVLDNTVVSEMCYGPVTTRAVTHDGRIDERVAISAAAFRSPRMLADALAGKPKLWSIMAQLAQIPSNHFVAECSYYSIPVGCKKENAIIWELQDDGTHKSIFR
jgi:hypothetical protein